MLYTPILNEFERSFDISYEDVTINFSYFIIKDKNGDITNPFDKVYVSVENYNEEDVSDIQEIYNDSFSCVDLKQEGNLITIPRHVFENGKKYFVRIRSENELYENDALANIEYSEFSARRVLQCFKAATTTIYPTYYDLINNRNIVSTSYVDLKGSYIKFSSMSDNIKWFKFDLYKKINDVYTFIKTSGEIRTSQPKNLNTNNYEDTKEFTYRFIDLDDDSDYGVKLCCCSQSDLISYYDNNNMSYFHTNLPKFDFHNIISISSNEDTGAVTMTTQFLQYVAETDGQIKYTNNQEVDATKGYHIIYKSGLDKLNDKYTIQIWVRNPVECERILCIGKKDETENIDNETYVKYYNRRFYLFVNSHGLSSLYISDEIFDKDYKLQANDQLYLYIRYSNNYENICMDVGIIKNIG